MKAQFKIEKGIKIPSKVHQVVKYPFREMEVGDSFLHPFNKDEKKGLLHSRLCNAGNAFCRWNNLKWKFSTREELKGFRMWRIK